MRAPALRAAVLAALLALAATNAPEDAARPVFLSDSQATYAELEQWQRQAGQCQVDLPDRQRRQQWQALQQAVRLDCQARPGQRRCQRNRLALDSARGQPIATRCEALRSSLRPREFLRRVEAVYGPELPGVPWPRVGMLRTGDANAAAFRLPGDAAPLILWNPDLGAFHAEVLRVVFSLMPFELGAAASHFQFSTQHIGQRLAQNPALAAHFKQLVHRVALAVPLGLDGTHDGFTAPPAGQFTGEAHERVVTALADEGLHFLLAHEMAHAIRGDTGFDAQAFLDDPVSRQGVTRIVRQIDQELSADAVGLKIWVRTLAHGDFDADIAALLSLAPELMLVSIRLVEAERERLRKPRAVTHPPFSLRRETLRDTFRAMGFPFPAQVADTGQLYLLTALFAWALLNEQSTADFARLVADSDLQDLAVRR
ncbi:MAG: hypothetical protein V4795_24040 [Pseudomonadota bacterium]